MAKLTNAEALTEIRAEAKKHGLTFGRMTTVSTIGGSPAYKFYPRGGGAAVVSNCTLGSAYELVCSGQLAQHAQGN
jgi:hypothetical protein